MIKAPTLILVLTAIALFLASCGSQPVPEPSLITATWSGSQHTFKSDNGMFIYQAAGYSVVQGAEAATADSLSLAFTGSNIGTYPIGPGYNSSVSISIGPNRYSSTARGAHGSIDITELNANTLTAKGQFSGTLVNTTHAADSIPVSAGTISAKYQF